MKQALALLLLVAVGFGYFYYARSEALQTDNANLTNALASAETKLEVQREEMDAQQAALESLHEAHAAAVRQRDQYLAAFGNDFDTRLRGDDEIESRIQRASGKVVCRLKEASGGDCADS